MTDKAFIRQRVEEQMPTEFKVTIDVYLINSQLMSISEPRRRLGAFFLWIARWLLKSELRLEEVQDAGTEENPPG